MRICICGGGNLGHVCAGFLANRGHQVSILTTKPERWNQTIEIAAPEGTFRGQLTLVTAKPEEVIPQADIVLICLPGFAIHEEMLQIKPFLSENSIVGSVVSSTGFFFEAFKVLPTYITLFGFQRVPFISRIIEYGRKVELKGYKESLHVELLRSQPVEQQSTAPSSTTLHDVGGLATRHRLSTQSTVLRRMDARSLSTIAPNGRGTTTVTTSTWTPKGMHSACS